MRLPTHADVLDARPRIAPYVMRTPTLRSERLDELAGGTVLIKAEVLQRIGAFKLRGATNAIQRLGPAERRAGVVAFSSGNHAQAVACAARDAGIHACIFMPSDAPRIKLESTLAWGAEVREFDRVRDDRAALARAHAERIGAAVVPPYDHPDIIAGQGTLALEIAEDAAAAGLRLDALLAGVSGGGLIAGCALALAGTVPGAEIWGVEPAGWDDTARSLAAGERLGNAPGGSFLCDCLLSDRPGELTFAINRTALSGVLTVSDDEVLAAVAFAFRHLKLVVEPGGAAALAALLAGRLPLKGRVAAVVLSGGNVDPAVFSRAIGAPPPAAASLRAI